MKVSRGRIPPGGWHFEVAPGVKLEAIDEETLVKRIFEYRLRNGIPIGDIERDIDNYYCSNWPDACHKEPHDWNPEISAPSVSVEPLLNRVSRWASLLAHGQPKGGYALVSAAEAQARGKICVGCSHNQHWRVGCRGCSNSTAILLGQMRKLQSSQHHGDLSGCTQCGWDNATAVWLPTDALQIPDTTKANLPERCWRKKL